ncbi:MAG: nickel-dependent lactate racemase [Anaerolineae bacterium]|jgi:nickel-dependent lactate racemase
MQVDLAYGQNGLTVRVPDYADVLLPREVPGLSDEPAAIRAALRAPEGRPPLRDAVRPHDRVVIVFSDITRPMPNDRVLPVLLDELSHVPDENIVLLNALGTHAPNSPEELESMLGAEIVRRYTIMQHDAWDEANLIDLGETPYGNRVRVNRTFYEATFKIITGFIEPHIFAGFSGGPKGVLPGVVAFDTIARNHGYEMLRHETVTWGHTDDNPVWQEMSAAARLARPDFLLNVTLNRHRQITNVFAGDLWRAHGEGVRFVREVSMVPVERPYDIVITTNSGYPLDINLYQAVKGMSVAAQIVRPGGSIIAAAECRQGIPDYGEYRNLVHEGGSVKGILEMISRPGFCRHDQWEAQLQANIMQVADVYVYSDYLSDEQLTGMLYRPCRDIEATLADLMAKYGADARICVLPEGPQTIPYLAS